MSDIKSSSEHKADNLKKFVPSTKDARYLNTNSADLKKLATAINRTHAAGVGFARKATEAMMECGAYLLEARELFKGDNEFGKWRKEHIDFSASHCTRIMAVTREFKGDERAALLPMGTLATLIPASDDLKEEVLEKAAKGETVKRSDVAEAKKEEKTVKEVQASPKSTEAESPSSTPQESSSKSSKKEPSNRLSPVDEAQVYLEMDFNERLDKLEPRGATDKLTISYMIFGIPPYHDGQCSLDLVHTLWHAYGASIATDVNAMSKFQTAYDTILDTF